MLITSIWVLCGQGALVYTWLYTVAVLKTQQWYRKNTSASTSVAMVQCHLMFFTMLCLARYDVYSPLFFMKQHKTLKIEIQ